MTDLHLADVEGTMDKEYSSVPPDALLEALEQAGRTPDRALLEACLARRDDLVPGLLKVLEAGDEQGEDEAWDEDDPRWYRDVHAGLLLIAFREEKALPLFANILRDEEREDLWDWLGVPFRHFGPLAVDMLIDLVKDRKANVWSRTGAGEKLKDIALLHPETRDRIVEVLRLRLPRVDEDGTFVVPPLADDDQVQLWTFVACELAELKDTASQPRVKALYQADWIDEMVMGDVDDYLKIFDVEPRTPRPFDLIEFYHPAPEKIAQREAAFEKHVDELDASFLALSTDELLHALEHAGVAPEPGLIRTCLKRQGAVTPGLLDLLARYEDPSWDDDDPRWYSAIHAGRLLIAFREEKALPHFEKILREDEEGVALEWYEDELPYYGPAALPTFTRLLQDASVNPWTRAAVATMLKAVAQIHPEAKPQVVDGLRAALPPLSERGDPVVPDEVTEGHRTCWTFVARALARLGDTAAKAQVEALHDWYLIDENVYGDYDGFLDILNARRDPFAPSPAFDLAHAYAQQYLATRPSPERRPVEEDVEDDPGIYPLGYGGEATYVRTAPKVGRNDPCPCGSGKKYKKCCGKR